MLGGTFDPIHVGHLALARSAATALRLDSIRFIPTGQSWQKTAGATPAAHRLAMVGIAIGRTPGWCVDDREVRRDGPTYTIDTLRELRVELGDEAALVLILGADQLRNLASWHRYAELPGLAHIAATGRGAYRLSDFDPEVEALVSRHGRDALPDSPSGSIVFFTMPPVPVSATALRQALQRGERPTGLLPGGVLDYIEEHHLYQGG